MLNEIFSLCCPDTKYIVVMVDDHLEYHGVLSVSIRYNPESKQWVALSEKSADFIATSSVSGPSLLLGPQSWRVSNDSADCSAQSYSARLSLSSCQGGNNSTNHFPKTLAQRYARNRLNNRKRINVCAFKMAQP